MKKKLSPFWVLFLVLLAIVGIAAVPSFTDFNVNQFNSANNKVSITSAATLTNTAITAGLTLSNNAASAIVRFVPSFTGGFGRLTVSTIPGSADLIFSDGVLSSDRFLGIGTPAFFGNAGGLSNAVDIIAGANITVTTNANKRSFTIAGSGGAGSQTPWTSDIDSAGFNLTNIGGIMIGAANGTGTILASGSTNLYAFAQQAFDGSTLIASSNIFVIGRQPMQNAAVEASRVILGLGFAPFSNSFITNSLHLYALGDSPFDGAIISGSSEIHGYGYQAGKNATIINGANQLYFYGPESGTSSLFDGTSYIFANGKGGLSSGAVVSSGGEIYITDGSDVLLGAQITNSSELFFSGNDSGATAVIDNSNEIYARGQSVLGSGAIITSSDRIHAEGHNVLEGANINGSSDLYFLGNAHMQFQAMDSSSLVFAFGNGEIQGALVGSDNIYSIGHGNLGSAITNVNHVFAFGQDNLEGATIIDSSFIHGEGIESFNGAVIQNNSQYLFGHGKRSFADSVIDGSDNLIASGDGVFNDANLVGASHVIGIGRNPFENAAITNTSDVYSFGNDALDSIVANDSGNIFAFGVTSLSDSTFNSAGNIYGYGNSAGSDSVFDNSSDVFAYGDSGLSGTTVANGSFSIYAYGNSALNSADLDGSAQVFAFGRALENAALTNSARIFALGQGAGAGLTGTFSDLFLVGAGTLPTGNNQFVVGNTYESVFQGSVNARTNIAQFDVNTTAFVLGTRYTNSNRRSFVTASFTLNGAAAGTAAVTLTAEQAGVTNVVKCAAGPLASLTTVEQLSLLVGPGAFYYFTDATSGVGASVAIVAGTSSRTDF